jgi:biotin transport system substrate-specific component
MQTRFVALAGIVLGSRDGFYSIALYVALGTAGLPWFAGLSGGPMVLLGPTGGYIAAFPFAAWLAGKVAEGFERRAMPVFMASILSSALIVFFGALYLSAAFHLPVPTAIALGVTPFLAVELFKAAVAIFITGRFPFKWK